MLDSVFCAVFACAAWWIGLTYVRMTPAGIVFNAIPSGILCGAAAYTLEYFGYGGAVVWTELAIFLLVMAAVQLQLRKDYGTPFLAFLLAQGANMVFLFAFHIKGAGTLISLVATFLCLGVVWKFRDRFPDADWREYYTAGTQEQERIKIRKTYIYLIPAVICAVLTAAYLLINTALGASAVILAAELLLFWGGIALSILMCAYKKERIAVLAEQQYRSEMQSFLNVIRSQRHDYNFHVQTIAGLVRSENLDECKKYVDALERDSAEMNAVLPIKDPAISALIHNFRILAVREGIELHLDIQNDLAQIATNVYETNKIISNLLQNAIDETITHQDKSYGIWLTILKRGEYCVIRVSNEVGENIPSAEELGRIYQQGYTTKHGHDGVGLSSIRMLATRYKGVVYTRLEGCVIHFIAKIPINYTKETTSE